MHPGGVDDSVDAINGPVKCMFYHISLENCADALLHYSSCSDPSCLWLFPDVDLRIQEIKQTYLTLYLFLNMAVQENFLINSFVGGKKRKRVHII